MIKENEARNPAFCLSLKKILNIHQRNAENKPTAKIKIKNSVGPCKIAKSILKAKREISGNIPNKTG